MQRLQEIRDRANKATTGPWETNERKTVVCHDSYRTNPDSIIASLSLKGVKTGEELISNAEFIAHARQDVPYLLDALEQAQKKNNRLQNGITEYVLLLCQSHDREQALRQALEKIYFATAPDKGLTMHETTQIYCIARDALSVLP